jgi:hypothetical protein
MHAIPKRHQIPDTERLMSVHKDNAPQPSPLYFFFPDAGPISWHNGFCSGVLRAASSGLCREFASIKQL